MKLPVIRSLACIASVTELIWISITDQFKNEISHCTMDKNGIQPRLQSVQSITYQNEHFKTLSLQTPTYSSKHTWCIGADNEELPYPWLQSFTECPKFCELLVFFMASSFVLLIGYIESRYNKDRWPFRGVSSHHCPLRYIPVASVIYPVPIYTRCNYQQLKLWWASFET